MIGKKKILDCWDFLVVQCLKVHLTTQGMWVDPRQERKTPRSSGLLSPHAAAAEPRRHCCWPHAATEAPACHRGGAVRRG